VAKPRRFETEVLAQFLSNCTVETNITVLQQKVNLSYYHAIEVAEKLVSIGCVVMVKKAKKNSKFHTHTVTITEMGRTALSRLTDANSILQSIRDAVTI